MKYQLVLQSEIAPTDSRALDELVAVENSIETIADDFEVDGHDIGSGQMNIFILTPDPERTYEKIKKQLPVQRTWVVAYRAVESEEYVSLEPRDLKGFEVK